jgi:hypothetical protein
MTTSQFKSLVAGVLLAASGTHLSQAQDPFVFNAPDLLLAVRATGGTGASQNLFVNLGTTTDFLGNGNRGTITNVANLLSDTYGTDWFEREDLWFGVAGNRDHLNPLFAAAPGPSEDPTRTWYVSRTAASPGGSVAWPAFGGNTLGSGGTNFSGLKRVFQAPTAGEQLLEVAPGVTILDQNAQPVAWNNSWTKWNPTPGAGFEIWTGGVQNSFGKAGDRSTVDVQRMVASTPGEFVVSISITSTGDIVAEGPVVTLPIPPFVDTDNDGLSDFLEDLLVDYGFDKNVAQPELVAQFMASEGYFTETSIQELVTAGQVMIQAVGNDVTLALPVFKTADLTNFTPAGNLQLTIPKEGDKQFYRIQLGE